MAALRNALRLGLGDLRSAALGAVVMAVQFFLVTALLFLAIGQTSAMAATLRLDQSGDLRESIIFREDSDGWASEEGMPLGSDVDEQVAVALRELLAADSLNYGVRTIGNQVTDVRGKSLNHTSDVRLDLLPLGSDTVVAVGGGFGRAVGLAALKPGEIAVLAGADRRDVQIG